MICAKCGNTVPSEYKFCDQCGMDMKMVPPPVAPPPPVTSPPPPPTPYASSTPVVSTVQDTPLIAGEIDPTMDYTPLGMWAYLGYTLLFAIPLAGFILLLVFSFGGTRNINLRNYARSFFCWLIVLAILLLIVLILSTVFVGSFLGSFI